MTSTRDTSRQAVGDVQIIEETEVAPPEGTRIRPGAVLAGSVTALATFLLLEMLLIATDLTGAQVSVANPDAGSWAWDAAAAIVAFLLGGLVAGASVPYRGTDTGALNGIVVWATTLIGMLVFVGVVGGAAFGALGDVIASQQDTLQQAANNAQVTEQTAQGTRDAAGWSATALILALAAAAVGGVMGSKMWPRDRLSLIHI